MIGVDVERRNEQSVATPRGDIDVASARQIGEELEDCLTAEIDTLVLDLSDTAYVDSAGLDMLFRLTERFRQRRAQLLLVIPADSQLARLVKIVALGSVVDIHDSLVAALDVGRGSAPRGDGDGEDAVDEHA